MDIANEIVTPWSSVGYLTYKRTYARRLDASNSESDTEEFVDTVERVIKATDDQLHCGFSEDEKNRLRKYMLQLKGTVAGRFLWQLGTSTVDKLGLASLMNCAFCVVDKPVEPFVWAFDMLMLGSGVGYNIQKENVDKIPVVNLNFKSPTRNDVPDADFIVPDSREGWTALLGKTLKAAFLSHKSGNQTFSYSTQLIRGKGAPIKGFGGTASGPEDLVWGIKIIGGILEKRAGKKIRPIDALDIMNVIGAVVVSGNVRRCLPEGSMVHTQRGLIPIENVNIGDYAQTSKGYSKVLNKFEQGEQSIMRIKTQDGFFDCTANHKMAVMDSIHGYTWKRASDLVSGDRLATTRVAIDGVKTNLPTWSYVKPEHSTTCVDITIPELDGDIAWLLGAIHGNGYVHVNQDGNGSSAISVTFNVTSPDEAEFAKDQLQRFGVNANLKRRKNENTLEVRATSRQLALYFAENFKKPNQPIEIPKCILEGTIDVRLAYLAGLADTDGAMHNRPVKLVSTVYQDFAIAVQRLAYSCGFETRLGGGSDRPNGWQPLYEVCMITNHSKLILNQTQQLHKEARRGDKDQFSNTFKSTWDIPTKVKRIAGYSVPITTRRYEDITGDKLDFIPVEVIGFEMLHDPKPTWDIEVEDDHEFFCNGYLTHNSAQLAIGDCDDVEYLLAKRWDMGSIPSWRAMSNNSVACNDFNDLHDYFWDGYEGKGEPYGLINLRLSRKIGRTGETQYPDPTVMGYNPCTLGDTLVSVKKNSERKAKYVRIDQIVKDFENGVSYKVRSYNTKTKTVEYKLITNAWMTRKDAEVLKISFEDGANFVKLTPDHKVYLAESSTWVEAKDLDQSEAMLMFSDEDNMQRHTFLHSIEKSDNADVYDLTVEGNHNFFANGLLVHNCAEQSLADGETCCLAEIYLSNIESEDELLDLAKLLYRVNKHSLMLPSHQAKTEKIVHENMRMGIGVTGFLQCTDEQKSWLDSTYKKLREFDVEYSKLKNVNASVKISTVKPSGSLSLLPGVTSGAHPAYSRFMKRRIRISSNHSLVQVCRDHGYHTEYQQNFDGSTDHSTIVVTFPFRHPDNAVLANDMTAIQQLETVKWLQTNWSDNSVSCTIYYRKEELPEIKKYLKKNYKHNFKSLSFLLHSDHGFKQAPLEEITEEEYNAMVASSKVITSISSSATLGLDENECAGGVCPIR